MLLDKSALSLSRMVKKLSGVPLTSEQVTGFDLE
jgi:hypothetical protein